jgi:hypothetical protein
MRGESVRLARWFQSALVLLAVSLALFAVPTQFEGPVLLDISPGHAIAVLDGVAIVPLLAANWLLLRGLWRGRVDLGDLVRRHPGRGSATIFAGGAGLGLLLASAFSAFFWWWAIGAALFGLVFVGCALAAAGRERPEERREIEERQSQG